MIKNIQEFKNTYVKNTPELREAFLSVADKFGVGYRETCGVNESKDCVVAFWQDVDGASFKIGCWYTYADQIKDECRELTLSDLKPRTRTEYEKVTESIFDLRDEFERGELYFKCSEGDWVQAVHESEVVHFLNNCGLYRKIEKEIDWREEVDAYFLKTKLLGIDCTIEEAITRTDYNNEFLEMCRVALRANGEVE